MKMFTNPDSYLLAAVLCLIFGFSRNENLFFYMAIVLAFISGYFYFRERKIRKKQDGERFIEEMKEKHNQHRRKPKTRKGRAKYEKKS